MKPTHANAFLAAALLCGLALYGVSPAARAELALPAPSSAQAETAPHPRVYLFRGFAGMVFSRGMDTLAEKLEQAGFSAIVNEAILCPVIAKDAVGDFRANPAPIVVIGHSVGAACAIAFAKMLDAEKINVSLAVTTDPNRIAEDVPLNVERYINIFQSNSILGGKDVKPSKGYSGHYASYDLVEHKDISHLNIEKTPTIHDQVLAKIQQLASTPAKNGADPLPIRLVVPADADLELWDSGIAVAARDGDTLQSMAAQYRVPLWALAQLNRVPQNGPVPAGFRIIVPQYLMPLAAASDGAGRDQPPKH